MFKKSIFGILTILVIALLVQASGFYTQALTFYNSSTYSTTTKNLVAATGKDTTEVFQLTKDEKRGYAEAIASTLTFQSIGIESSTTDSMKLFFTLDLSMDGVNWINHGAIDTLTSTKATTGATVTDLAKVTTHKNARYGRIRITAAAATGDTSTCQIYLSKAY